jgi:hypothetical protein
VWFVPAPQGNAMGAVPSPASKVQTADGGYVTFGLKVHDDVLHTAE